MRPFRNVGSLISSGDNMWPGHPISKCHIIPKNRNVQCTQSAAIVTWQLLWRDTRREITHQHQSSLSENVAGMTFLKR